MSQIVEPQPADSLSRLMRDAVARHGPAVGFLGRRAALTLVARALADRFTFSDPEAVAASVDAVERGVPLAPEMRTRMMRSRATGDGGAGGSAVNGLHAATATGQGPNEPLDLLNAATYAVPDEWPRLRRAVDRLLRG